MALPSLVWVVACMDYGFFGRGEDEESPLGDEERAPDPERDASATIDSADAFEDTSAPLDTGADTAENDTRPDAPTDGPTTGVLPYDTCLSVAEAWDDGLLTLDYDGWYHNLRNLSDQVVCLDDWMSFFSELSQDVGLGDRPVDAAHPLFIDPGTTASFQYGVYSYGVDIPVWMCVEQTQITQVTDAWWAFGARLPEPLRAHLQSAKDADQTAVWNTILDNPVVLVGRTDHTIDAQVDDLVTIEVRALNLGRQPASAIIREVVPSLFEIVDAGSATAVENSDDSTTLTWSVALEGALDTADTALPTVYDDVTLPYMARVRTCPGPRTVGNLPKSTYEDAEGITREAWGSPLVLRCP